MTDPIPSPRSPQPDPLREAIAELPGMAAPDAEGNWHSWKAWDQVDALLAARSTPIPSPDTANVVDTFGAADVPHVHRLFKHAHGGVLHEHAIPSPDTDLRQAAARYLRAERALDVNRHAGTFATHAIERGEAREKLEAALSSSESTETLDAAPERPTLDGTAFWLLDRLSDDWERCDIAVEPSGERCLTHGFGEPCPVREARIIVDAPDHFAALRALAARLTDSREQTR